MTVALFTHDLEKTLRADEAAIRRDAVAMLARIIRQEGPPSDRALATLWLYQLAIHDPDVKVREMAAVPIRLTTVWPEGLGDKLYSPHKEVRMDFVYTLEAIMDTGRPDDAQEAYRCLGWLSGSDPAEEVREAATRVLGWDIPVQNAVPAWQPVQSKVHRISHRTYNFLSLMAVVGILTTFVGLPLFILWKLQERIIGLAWAAGGLICIGTTLWQMRRGGLSSRYGTIRGPWLLVVGPILLLAGSFFAYGGLAFLLPCLLMTGRVWCGFWIGLTIIGCVLSAPHTFIPCFKRMAPITHFVMHRLARFVAPTNAVRSLSRHAEDAGTIEGK